MKSNFIDKDVEKRDSLFKDRKNIMLKHLDP